MRPRSRGDRRFARQPISPLLSAVAAILFFAGGQALWLATVLCLGLPPTSFAGVKTWANTGTDFNTGSSWTGGSVPKQTGDSAAFSGPEVTNPNLSASYDFQAINFSLATSLGYTLSSSNTSITLTLESISSGSSSAINAANTSGTNTVSAPVIFGASSGTQFLTVAAGGTLSLSGVISSTSSPTVEKDGTGTLIFSGTNTYTGATTINAGVLNIRNSSALGSTAAGTTVVSGATLQLQGGITVGAEALTISGTGASGQTGALVNVSGTNNYGGLITLGAATTISSDSGTLNLTNSGTITGATFGLTLTGSGSGSLASIIGTTSGGLTKNGTGTWTLSGASTYTGTTTVNAGSLFINGSTSSSSAVTVNNSGTLGGNGTIGGSVTVNNGGTLAPGATGNGSTAVLHTGALTMTTGSIYSVNLNGNVAGTGYDQIIATSVALGGSAGVNGATLSLNSVSNLNAGDQLFIILNSSGSAMTSTFNGLAEGATITFGSYSFTIDYFANGDGGTIGNDVALTVTGVPEPATWIAGVLTCVALACSQRKRLIGLRD